MSDLAEKKSPTKERLSKQPRHRKKKLVSPPSPNASFHSLDMEKIKIARPGKPDLIDTNVPGLPFREPNASQSRLDLPTVCLGPRNKNFFHFRCLLLLIGQARRYG